MPLYKGYIEWEDEFDGEKTEDGFATHDANVEGLIKNLMRIASGATVTLLEIKRVRKD